jgi:hypothetical protein
MVTMAESYVWSWIMGCGMQDEGMEGAWRGDVMGAGYHHACMHACMHDHGL